MRYLKYNYKRMFMPFVFLTIIGTVFYALPIFLNSSGYSGGSYLNGVSNITTLLVYLIIVAIFIPVYEFAPLKNSRGADLYYSLPLDKKRLYLQFYLKGLIEIVSSYIVVFFLGLLGVVIKGYPILFIYYIPLFFLLLLGTALYYTFNVFIFSKANRTIDGIIFIIMYLIIPIMIYLFVSHFAFVVFKINFEYYLIDALMPISPLYIPGNYFNALIEKRGVSDQFNTAFVFTLIWALISIAFGLLMILYTKTNKPENVQSKSNSWFGYKVFIPLLLYISISTTMDLEYLLGYSFVLTFIFMVTAYIGYVIYERKFKISLNSLIVLGSTTFLGILTAVILSLF